MRRAAVTGRSGEQNLGWLEELGCGETWRTEASVVQGRPQLAQEEPLLPGCHDLRTIAREMASRWASGSADSYRVEPLLLYPDQECPHLGQEAEKEEAFFVLAVSTSEARELASRVMEENRWPW